MRGPRRETSLRHSRASGGAGEWTSGARVIRPPWWLMAVPVVLIAAYVFAEMGASAASRDFMNVVGPVGLGVSALAAGVRLLRRAPEAAWTPYGWFLLAVVAFYSVGPLVYPLADADTVRRASSLYKVTPAELLRTNLLNSVGVLAVLSGFWMVSRLGLGLLSFGSGGTVSRARTGRYRDGQPVSRPTRVSSVSAELVALAFLVVGGCLQYLIILPARFGALDVVLPGIFWNLGRVHLLGIALMAYVVARGKRSWRIPFWILWGLQLLVSLLLFSKLELILSLVLPALGAYASHRRLKRLLLWGALATTVYLSVPHLVLHGREQIRGQTGATDRAGLTQRAEILVQWYERGMPSLRNGVSPLSTGWTRLNYAPVQAFAMARYDDGYPGNSLRYAGIVLIPRLLWPDKPVTTDLGVDFYQLMTGRRSTHLGLGIFGEGYWNLGWFGVVGLSLATGVMFGLVSRFSLGWIRRREFIYLPSIMLGIQMGAVGTTGLFANSVVGGGAILAAYAVTCWMLVRLIAGVRRRHRVLSGSLPRHASHGPNDHS